MVKPIPEEIAEEARRQVAGGFTPVEEIVESIVEIYAEEHEEGELRLWAERSLEEALAEQRRAQAEWPVPTDCDRLDRAFAALEESGIVARQNFTCCQSCGSAEIGDEGDGDGYTFYHMQDTDSAVDGSGLYLAYGALKPGVDPVQVGKEVVEKLQKEGLTVDWNGSVETRIFVNLEWRRRRKPNG